MTVAERLRDAADKLYLTMRDPKAWQPGGAATPVWFGLAEGKLCFRTYADSAKVKRIRANPRVLIGPCDLCGMPLGPMLGARARPLPSNEESEAEEAIQGNYGLFRRMYLAGFSGRLPDTYVEVTPT